MPLLTPVTTNTLLVSLPIYIEAFIFDDLESGWSGIAGAFGIYLYELQRSGICYGHGIDAVSGVHKNGHSMQHTKKSQRRSNGSFRCYTI